MEAQRMVGVWMFISIIFCEIRLDGAVVVLDHNNPSVLADTFICGREGVFTCKINPAPVLMSWLKDSNSLTDCQGTTDSCFDATVENYQFSSNVSANEYYLTVNPVKLTNEGTFTCSNGASEDDSKTVSIAALSGSVMLTQESGTGPISLQVTTDCVFPLSAVSVEWYYLKDIGSTPVLFEDDGFNPVRTTDSSSCTSGDCSSGVGVSKVISSVTFNENGDMEAYLQAKVVHSAAPSDDPDVTVRTSKKYKILKATTTAAPGPDGGCDARCKAGIFVGVVFLLFIIGCIVGCVKAALVEDKKNLKWIWLSCIIIVGLGILTVMFIRRCFKKSQRGNKPEEEPMQGRKSEQSTDQD